MSCLYLYDDKTITLQVVHVTKAADFAQTGRWDIRIKDLVTGTVDDAIFDAVMVCSGHHADKKVPSWPGLLLTEIFFTISL